MLAKQYHPDHNPDDLLAEEKFKEIHEAYRILSDDNFRISYDLGGWNFKPGQNESHDVSHYFYAQCDTSTIGCFEEITITFTYSGNGRIFRKPSFDGFYVTGAPFVSSRMLMHEGNLIKETTLTYIICPLMDGAISIQPASIYIQNKIFYTESFSISVNPVDCFFLKNQKANGKPLKFTVHYEFNKGEEPFRISEKMKNHTILIPRSKSARYFHSLASAMKWVCTIYGMIACNYYLEWNIIVGFIAGNLFGGINCFIMYKLLGMKSKFYYSSKYPVILNYMERGYFLGESSGIALLKGNGLYYIKQFLV